jgi:hypothetical protein
MIVENEAAEHNEDIRQEDVQKPVQPEEQTEQPEELNQTEVPAPDDIPPSDPQFPEEIVPVVVAETQEELADDIPPQDPEIPAQLPPVAESEQTQQAEVSASEPESLAEPEVHEEVPDYAGLEKSQLLAEMDRVLRETDLRRLDLVLKPLKTAFDDVREQERQAALQKFLADGGEAGDFDFKPDELTQQLDRVYRQVRDRKTRFAQEQEQLKQKNLQRKQELLEQLRSLVEGEETQESFQQFKHLQQEWKSIGVLPAGTAKELWASYEILRDRFHNKMSIYQELKELDRKKNAQHKLEIIEKAEKLAEREEVGGQVMKDLNDLHDEYKHVGPAPKDEQETLWQRFKTASDKIYEKRRQQQEKLKEVWDENYQKKLAIIELVDQYAHFQTEKIAEWNDKTKELLELQKQWDAIGSLSREKAKEVSKRFWASFKQFFHNKTEFFRKLEEQRDKNLQAKLRLVEEAEALMSSEDFDRTTERMKTLQQEWKEIGPVPEKMRDKIFDRFKAACDAFFNRKRNKVKETEGSYENNLLRKQQLCEQLETMAAEKSGTMAEVKRIQSEYNSIGFVPRKDMDRIRKRFNEAVDKVLETLNNTREEKTKAKLTIEIEAAQNDPKVQKQLDKHENHLRKRLTQLENDVAVWQNNMSFFGKSKNAESVLKDFVTKIEEAQKEIESLKQQLKMIQQS